MYFNLLEKLSNFDRNHNSKDIWNAYKVLNKFYKGARLIKFKSPKEINKWKMIPYWECKKAELRDSNNKVIVSKKKNNLSIYSFSPSVNKTISYTELKKHITFDKKRPNATIFHFRNQYRHWKPEWGFSIPFNKYKRLNKKKKYKVLIESKFEKNKGFVQSDFIKKGKRKDAFIFIGHFDHPNQVNDGLAGVIAAYETIRRIKKLKTEFTYIAFASIEIIGSVYYLHKFKDLAKNLKEGLFNGFSGIKSNIVYQKSFFGNSLIDKIMANIFLDKKYKLFFNHRQLAGNDENIFDSVGYNISTGTLMRWPFKEYHTDDDNIEITYKEKIEEMVLINLKVINLIEKNKKYKALYKGVPCLSSDSYNLYLNPSKKSRMRNKVKSEIIQRLCKNLTTSEIRYINKNMKLMYGLMNNSLRMATGEYTVLDVANKSKLPFNFVYNYIQELKKKKLVHFI